MRTKVLGRAAPGIAVAAFEAPPRLPAGYRLDASAPDLWALRAEDGTPVAYFSVREETS